MNASNIEVRGACTRGHSSVHSTENRRVNIERPYRSSRFSIPLSRDNAGITCRPELVWELVRVYTADLWRYTRVIRLSASIGREGRRYLMKRWLTSFLLAPSWSLHRTRDSACTAVVPPIQFTLGWSVSDRVSRIIGGLKIGFKVCLTPADSRRVSLWARSSKYRRDSRVNRSRWLATMLEKVSFAYLIACVVIYDAIDKSYVRCVFVKTIIRKRLNN